MPGVIPFLPAIIGAGAGLIGSNLQNKQAQQNQQNAQNNAVALQQQGTQNAQNILGNFYKQPSPTAGFQNPTAPPVYGSSGAAGGSPQAGGAVGGQQIGNAPPPGQNPQIMQFLQQIMGHPGGGGGMGRM